MEQIKVIINKDNYSITIEAEGYEGTTCLKDVDELQELLRAITLSEELKDDAFTVKRTGKINLKGGF